MLRRYAFLLLLMGAGAARAQPAAFGVEYRAAAAVEGADTLRPANAPARRYPLRLSSPMLGLYLVRAKGPAAAPPCSGWSCSGKYGNGRYRAGKH